MTRRAGRYPQELRERAVRMVIEHRDEYDTEWAAMRSIAEKLGIGTTETLRKWVLCRRRHKAQPRTDSTP
jgi:transposase